MKRTQAEVAAEIAHVVRRLNGWSHYDVASLLYTIAKGTGTVEVFNAFECSHHRSDCVSCTRVLAEARRHHIEVAEGPRREAN